MGHVEQLTDGVVWLTVPGASDVDAIAAACADPAVGEWTTVPVPYTRADAASFVGTIVPALWEQGNPTWAIRSEPDGEALGMVGLVVRDGVGDLGYWLAPAWRSRGLTTAAVKVVCRHGFGLGLDRIEWRAYVGNHASAAVARKVGFRYEGLTRRAVLQRGVRRDCWLASLLPDDPMVPAVGWPAGV